jgi:hypothetical protein
MGKTRKNRIYSDTDYNSNDGMLTSVWGPSMWHVLHTMSFNYPVKPTVEDKHHYRDYVLNLRWTLPCGKCRNNFKTNQQKLPLLMKHMACRATFSRYIYDLHELINTMLKKKSGLTYEMARERYEHFRSRCTKPVDYIPPPVEKGCIEPLYKGEKSKCVLKIVPQSKQCETFQVDDKCVKQII